MTRLRTLHLNVKNLTPDNIQREIKSKDSTMRIETGPPMSGKTSILRAIRYSSNDRYGLTESAWKKWLDGGSIKLTTDPASAFLVGPRGAPKELPRIDFTGPKKAAQTLFEWFPAQSEEFSWQERQKLARFAFGRASGEVKAKLEMLRHARQHVASAGAPTTALDREIAATMEEEARVKEQTNQAKAKVKSVWPQVTEWVFGDHIYPMEKSLQPEIDVVKLTDTGSLALEVDGREDERTLSTGSGGVRAAFELAMYCRFVDALEAPAFVLLDDEELSGWSGPYLCRALEALEDWVNARNQPAFVWVARQDDPTWLD